LTTPLRIALTPDANQPNTIQFQLDDGKLPTPSVFVKGTSIRRPEAFVDRSPPACPFSTDSDMFAGDAKELHPFGLPADKTPAWVKTWLENKQLEHVTPGLEKFEIEARPTKKGGFKGSGYITGSPKIVAEYFRGKESTPFENQTHCAYYPSRFAQGFPTKIHGGCVWAIIDDALVIHSKGRGVTASLNVTYLRPADDFELEKVYAIIVKETQKQDMPDGKRIRVSTEVEMLDPVSKIVYARGVGILVLRPPAGATSGSSSSSSSSSSGDASSSTPTKKKSKM